MERSRGRAVKPSGRVTFNDGSRDDKWRLNRASIRKNLSDSYENAGHATRSAAEPPIGAHVAFTARPQPLRSAQS